MRVLNIERIQNDPIRIIRRLKMALSKIEALNRDELLKTHDATLKVLEQTGVVFDDEEAMELFKKHGAKVNGKIVHFPPEMVENAIEASPSTFDWVGRDDAYTVSVAGGHKQVIGPTMSAVSILDEETGIKRSSVAEDAVNFMKLHHASDVIQIVGLNTVEPTDIAPEERHLRMCYEALKNTTKPLLNYTVMNYAQQAIDLFDMLELAYGKIDRAVVGHTMCPFSPLQYEGPVMEVLREFAKRKQPILVSPCALTGLTAPIDLLGSAVQQNAENLALLTYVHLFSPGTPVVVSPHNNIGYMAKATNAWGSPEAILASIPCFQLAIDMYKIPCRVIGGVSTSKKVDYQAAIETTQNIMMSLLGGVDIAYINTGCLDNLLTLSYTKHIMDEEILSRVLAIRNGVPFSEEALSVDMIHEVGHGGTYLMHPRTMERFRDRWVPMVSDWDVANGEDETIEVRAKKRWKTILENAPESFLDEELDKELKVMLEQKLKK
ncbi:MAG: trimethylamine methyltransferase family protein [Clostridia bacterium]